MALDLSKGNKEFKYYYSDKGSTLGPFFVSELLEKIDGDTLVYRESIDWTNAKDIVELSNYFSNETSKSEYNVSNTTFQTSSNGTGLSKKMFLAPFSFEGRIRRTEYAISFLIYLLVSTLVSETIHKSGIIFFIFVPLLWFLWAQGAKRCHDRGNSGWYQIIPFYVLWMFFAEGDNMGNEYGDSPK